MGFYTVQEFINKHGIQDIIKNADEEKLQNVIDELLKYDEDELYEKELEEIFLSKSVPEKWVIYTKDGCGYCKDAKKLLTKNKIEFTDIPVTSKNKDEIYSVIDNITDSYRYFPVIIHNNEFIGGFTELKNILT